MATNREVGRRAERKALALLRARGLRLVRANYTCRRGEIDLIMEDGDTLVFVEVRFRRSTGFGSAVESVDAGKRRRIVFAARHYLQRYGGDRPCRFDVVGVTPAGVTEWIPNAFEA